MLIILVRSLLALLTRMPAHVQSPYACSVQTSPCLNGTSVTNTQATCACRVVHVRAQDSEDAAI